MDSDENGYLNMNANIVIVKFVGRCREIYWLYLSKSYCKSH